MGEVGGAEGGVPHVGVPADPLRKKRPIIIRAFVFITIKLILINSFIINLAFKCNSTEIAL